MFLDYSQEPYTIFLSVVSKCSSKRILTCSHVGVDQPWKNDKREGKTKQLVLLFRSSILSLLWFSDLSSSLKFVSGVRRRMRARAGAGGPLFPCSFFFFCCSSSLRLPCQDARGSAVGLRPGLKPCARPSDPASSQLLVVSRRGTEAGCAGMVGF